MNIAFNVPHLTGKELSYINEAMQHKHLSGDGIFTNRCNTWLESTVTCKKSLLVPSCTAALEMAAILLDISPGDEVILPSFTFVSTANAFVLRGGIPIFVDIRKDTLNIDETKIAAAITTKTKAIVVVHYAGVACEMDTIMAIANQHGIYVVEDAAQALMSKYNEKSVGSIGHLSAFSFHATKNIISGEGGALCINDSRLLERAEIIREKGTNRKQFFEGQVDKYTWLDIGSSYLTNEITAAFLLAQLESATEITQQRLAIWNSYAAAFDCLDQELIMTPNIPWNCYHNAHIYFLVLPSHEIKLKIMQYCRDHGINTASHYVPLHLSDAGIKFGRGNGDLSITEAISSRILRLPLWIGVEQHQNHIIGTLLAAINLFVTAKTPNNQFMMEI